MRQYSDDDIEVLGSDPTPKRKAPVRVYVAAGVLVAIGVILTVYGLTRPDENVQDESPEATAVAEATTEDVDTVATAATLPVEFTDSINDVVFTVISLQGYKAEVAFGTPDSTDSDILVAVPAADLRADNGQIVCEFIHDRQALSRGVRKQGYCYISPQGDITIGAGSGEAHRQAALDQGGTFFRQYPLVMDGEIQPNILKGKSERRALAFLHGTPTVVVTKNRESIYDFSQALADYGFSHAIYLPGGKSFVRLHTDKSDLCQKPEYDGSEYANYLIFKK